ncbi:multidrug resistance protein mdtA [Acetobacter malorum]|uniref:Multidrug resistance protein mdtA n=1 Tax=Acetobacter malorum TaxID=178901 RepID=A0A149RQA4_9PROT|nr:multidrug resistance protein mdtA [Acetobacter malorum]
MPVVGCNRHTPSDPRTAPRAVLAIVPSSTTSSSPIYPAVVAARVQPTLAFRVAGKIVSRKVDEGQVVHRGDVMMTLDRTDLAHDVTSQSANAASLRAAWENAAADERRYRGLDQTGAVSKSFYDGIRSRAESLHAQLMAADANRRIATDRDDYTVLRADHDGTVLSVLAEVGNVVSAGQPVLTFASAGPLEASVDLPEDMNLPIGSSAIVSDAKSDQIITRAASLRQIAAIEDTATRTVNARYIIPNSPTNLRIGQTLTVTLTSSLSDDMVVPLSAVFDTGSAPGVWIIEPSNKKVAFHPVPLRRVEGGAAVIMPDQRMRDLRASGELQVVAAGVHDLHAGEAVTIAPDQAQMQ